MAIVLCNSHGLELRNEIRKHGLGRYLTDDPAKIKKAAEAWMSGSCPVNLLEPYVIANLEFLQRFHTEFDVAPTTSGCPICYVSTFKGEKMAKLWMQEICIVLVALFKENNLKIGD